MSDFLSHRITLPFRVLYEKERTFEGDPILILNTAPPPHQVTNLGNKNDIHRQSVTSANLRGAQ